MKNLSTILLGAAFIIGANVFMGTVASAQQPMCLSEKRCNANKPCPATSAYPYCVYGCCSSSKPKGFIKDGEDKSA